MIQLELTLILDLDETLVHTLNSEGNQGFFSFWNPVLKVKQQVNESIRWELTSAQVAKLFRNFFKKF